MSDEKQTSCSPNAPANEEYSWNYGFRVACACHQYSRNITKDLTREQKLTQRVELREVWTDRRPRGKPVAGMTVLIEGGSGIR